MELFIALEESKITKDVLPDVFVWLSKNDSKNLSDAINSLGLRKYSIAELSIIVDNIISENKQSIQKLGQKSFSKLMGIVMRQVRGKADPATIIKIIKEKLK